MEKKDKETLLIGAGWIASNLMSLFLWGEWGMMISNVVWFTAVVFVIWRRY